MGMRAVRRLAMGGGAGYDEEGEEEEEEKDMAENSRLRTKAQTII